MAKAVKEKKKKNIRLRRTLRKTFGTLFLVSAIGVAAIPVEGLGSVGAEGEPAPMAEAVSMTWDSMNKSSSKIPLLEAGFKNIYVDENGRYAFAYFKPTDSESAVAMILKYFGGQLEGNALTIPGEVDAYAKYRTNDGSDGGYVAVSANRDVLYYMSEEPHVKLDASGNATDQMTDPVFSPCTKDDKKWDREGNMETYYYYRTDADPTDSDSAADSAAAKKYNVGGYWYVQTVEVSHQWIRNQTVSYIGNQSLKKAVLDGTPANGSIIPEYEIAEATPNTVADNGVFANQANIISLNMTDKLRGVGNYAFYHCTNLASVTFGNGLEEVGHHAFAECGNMTSIGIDFASNLKYIADYTFYKCEMLSSFTLPSNVDYIYDHAFDGCISLSNVDLIGKDKVKDPVTGQLTDAAMQLDKLGYYVFQGCTSLRELVLPTAILKESPVDLNNFKGCSSLEHIVSKGTATSFEAKGADFTVDNFKDVVPKQFYFEAAGVSQTHEFTKKNAIAFKYADEDRYEVIIKEKDVGGIDCLVTYQVNHENALIWFDLPGEVPEITIPSAIGPYGVSAIGEGSFSGNCNLTKIVIPATVTGIKENAFKGCHNLKHVIFEDAATITEPIGKDAFATQVKSCSHTLEKTPMLTFTGTVGTGIEPFDYAMSEAGKISTGTQPDTYITYYSGWPTNLEIEYQKPTSLEGGKGKATLTGYPRYGDLSSTNYNPDKYPYITEEMKEIAGHAVSDYETWLGNNKAGTLDSDVLELIRASLNPEIPEGVEAVEEGLFNGASVTENEDGTYTVSRASGEKADDKLETISFAGLGEYTPYMFDGCSALQTIGITGGEAKIDDYAFAWVGSDVSGDDTSLSSLANFNMTGGGSSIGDYAFDKNPKLNNVTISSSVSSLGIRPFRNCTSLQDVSFSGGPHFTTESGVIFGKTNNVKTSVIECLEATSSAYFPTELFTGVTGMAEEAFMDCGRLESVDLSKSSIKTVPKNAFNNAGYFIKETQKGNLDVVLPEGCGSIEDNAFHNSGLRQIAMPDSISYIANTAFDTPDYPNSSGSYVDPLIFVCSPEAIEEKKPAVIWGEANAHDNIDFREEAVTRICKVEFYALNESGDWVPFIDAQEIKAGESAAVPTQTPVREGYTFVSWELSPTGPVIEKLETYNGYYLTNVTGDMLFKATYKNVDSAADDITVSFVDWDDKVLYTQKVKRGEDAMPPQNPTRAGYTFTGWRPGLTKIDPGPNVFTYTVYAQYDSGSGGGSGDVSGGGSGSGSGNGSGNGGNGSGGTVSGGDGKFYTVTVKNGSGSGSYLSGTQVVIWANDPASGQTFSHWTVESGKVTLPSTKVAATAFNMPTENVTLVANYKTSGGGNANNNGSGNNGTVSGGNLKPNNNSGGTTVVIDKNGLSNTGVVSAVVNGSSDNFTVKVSENSAATEAAVRALMAEYGTDLSNIKYFPMDISLYDSTGTKKITDTTGLKITVTLPLPDSLVEYAGNNKVAGVVNDRLDKLNPEFTTIQGVPCVKFSAEHFSPYVMYVDISNLSAGGGNDDTPKTGDGIHPKWFLSVGLACVSIVLFMKKDRKTLQKVRA